MRTLTILALALCAAPAFCQTGTEKRVSGLEKRMTGVEKRVTKLERSPAPGPAAAEKMPAEPITVTFLKKKQVVTQDKVGVRLSLEIANASPRSLFAFNGVLVFRNEAGEVLMRRDYAYSEPLAPGEAVQVTLGISSERAKEYLKFVKAKGITVKLEKQEIYEAS